MGFPGVMMNTRLLEDRAVELFSAGRDVLGAAPKGGTRGRSRPVPRRTSGGSPADGGAGMPSDGNAAPSFSAPVAIGGLGGSGTRVVARMLQLSGCDIGSRLNGALDNLWFTVLFKRIDWTRRAPRPEELELAAALFRRAMTAGLGGTPGPAGAQLLDSLRRDLPPNGGWRCGAQVPDLDTLLHSPGAGGDRWGWKEPNTHVFLPALVRHLPGLRYIHVVRDGLDMAFSHNLQQLRNWSHLYGLPQDEPESPARQLRYWTAANRRALDFGRTHLQDRFLVVSYEAVCAEPLRHWQRLLRFLGQPEDRPLPEEFLIRPCSIGRAQQQDLSCLPAADVAAAQDLAAEVARLDQAPFAAWPFSAQAIPEED